MTIHKLRLSINEGIVNKTPLLDKRSLSEGFVTVESTLDNLAKAIKKGFAFSYEFKDGRRLTKNFIGASFLAVDIDGGIALEESLKDDFVKQYCSLIYTTHSHTKEINRYRLVFVLPRFIENPLELRYATRSLASKLGGDKSVVDAARMFYGCKGAETYIYKNKLLTEKVLKELIADGETEVVSDSVANNGNPSATRSGHLLHKKELITLANGRQTSLEKIKVKTSVFCPSHRDKNASAFVNRNKHGVAYLYCSTCQMTRWEMGVQNHILSTENFEDALLKIDSRRVASNDLMGLERFMEKGFDVSIKKSPVQNDKHLLLEKINDGITFIKSPKGTGKTHSISNALKKEVNGSSGKNKKILLIGHRQALIRNLCTQMGLNCYLNEDSTSGNRFRDRYGICLDSLLKIKDSTYDIVVIDEVEQVLAHFLSETIGSSNAPQIFKEFSRILSRAKKVVVMDADLGWTSVLTLTTVIANNKNSGDKKFPLNFVINQWKAPNKSVLLYKQKDHLLGVMKEKLREGKKIFFTSNSKSVVKDLASALKKERVLGRKVKLIAVTSENSSTNPVQHFINNIRTQISQYDIVLTSPSLSTGIDISFDNNASEIDCVFGIFENRINSHPEIDQQISRVRNPKEIHLWISPMKYNFETEFDVVEEDYLKNRLSEVVVPIDDLLAGIGMKDALLDFIHMATWITVLRRSSLNNLRGNYIEYKKRQGVEVIPVDADKSIQDVGKKLRVLGRTISDKEFLSNVLKAEVLSRLQYKDLRTQSTLNESDTSIEDLYSMRRYEIESFYGQKITKDLILLDNYGKYRNQIRFFEQLTDKDYFRRHAKFDNISLSLENKLKLCVIKVDLASKYLMADLLGVTPFYKKYSFDSRVEFESAELLKFVINVKQLKKYVEGQLGIQVRADINYKPISQLKQFLKLIGLDVVQVSRQVIAGKKYYRYSISPNHLNQVQSIVEQRKMRESDEDDDSDSRVSFRAKKTIKIPILEDGGVNLEAFLTQKSRK
jgi:Origin of replication binding protein